MITFLVVLLLGGQVLPYFQASTQASPCRPRVETPIEGNVLVDNLRAQHEVVFGTPSPRGRLISAVTHIFFENALGAKVWNHNLGNLWAPPTAPHFDLLVGQRREPYASLDDFASGAKLYWTVMSTRCPRALASFWERRSDAPRCGDEILLPFDLAASLGRGGTATSSAWP